MFDSITVIFKQYGRTPQSHLDFLFRFDPGAASGAAGGGMAGWEEGCALARRKPPSVPADTNMRWYCDEKAAFMAEMRSMGRGAEAAGGADGSDAAEGPSGPVPP